jgi:hypothetical protein
VACGANRGGLLFGSFGFFIPAVQERLEEAFDFRAESGHISLRCALCVCCHLLSPIIRERKAFSFWEKALSIQSILIFNH